MITQNQQQNNNYFDEILQKESPETQKTPEKTNFQNFQIEGKYHKVSKISSSIILQNQSDDKIAKEITKKREQFIDASFLPNDPKNYEDTFSHSNTFYELLRPSDFLKGGQIKLFNECKIEGFYDIGDMTQDYFLDVLTSLSTQRDLIKRLFKQSKSSGFGLYQIFLNNDGKWTQVTVDDQIAFNHSENSSLGISPLSRLDHSEPDLWAFLLEKAYAKLIGGYHKLNQITFLECLEDFTGAPAKVYNVKELIHERKTSIGRVTNAIIESREGTTLRYTRSTFGRFSQSLNPAFDLLSNDKDRNTWDQSITGFEKIYSVIQKAILNGNLVIAGNLNSIDRGSFAVFKGSRVLNKNDIGKGRAYSVIRILEINKNVKLVQLLKPFGVEDIFKGSWDKNSDNWKNYPELFKKAYERNQEFGDNTFWMTLEEFSDKFEDLIISEIEPGLQQNSIILKEYENEINKGMTTGIVQIKVWKDGFYHITLHQGKNSFGISNQIELTLFKIKKTNSKEEKKIFKENIFHFIDHCEGIKKTLTISSKLSKGDYIALIRCYQHPKIINSRQKFSSLILTSYGYSTCSLAFLQTEIPTALPPLFSTMNYLAWRSFINQSENLLSGPFINSKYPNKVNNTEFFVDDPEGGESQLAVDVENWRLEELDVNLFRLKFSNIGALNKHYDGYFEIEISYNSNFFIFEGGEIYESEILDIEQYNEGLETILVRTPRLDLENSSVILLKKKYHNSIIKEELGDKFIMDIKDVQFVLFSEEGDNELELRSENVKFMLSESVLLREQSPIEISFESGPVKNKGFLISKNYEENFDFILNSVTSLRQNYEEFVKENQFDNKILDYINEERLQEIQGIIGLEMNCWIKLLERLSLSLINYSVESLRKSLTVHSSAFKLKQSNIQNINFMSKGIIDLRDLMIEKCQEFKMRELRNGLKENWILNEVESLRKTENFTSPNLSLYKRDTKEGDQRQGSINFRLEGSKGSFFGGIISDLKTLKRDDEEKQQSMTSSSLFNSSEKKATNRLLSFGKFGIQTGRVESERSVKATLVSNQIFGINSKDSNSNTNSIRNDKNFQNEIDRKILFQDENIENFYKPDPAPIDFFKDYKETTYENFDIVQQITTPKKEGTNNSGIKEIKRVQVIEKEKRVLDVESPESIIQSNSKEPPIDNKNEELSDVYHLMIQSKLSENSKERQRSNEKSKKGSIVESIINSGSKPKNEIDQFFYSELATKTQPVISSRTRDHPLIFSNNLSDEQKKKMFKKLRNNFITKNEFKSPDNYYMKNEEEVNIRISKTIKDEILKKTSNLMNLSLVKKKQNSFEGEIDKKNTPEYLKKLEKNDDYFADNFDKGRIIQFNNLDEEEKEKLDSIVDSYKKKIENNSDKKQQIPPPNNPKISKFGDKLTNIIQKIDFQSNNENFKKKYKYTSLAITASNPQNPSDFTSKINNFARSRRHQKLKSTNNLYQKNPNFGGLDSQNNLKKKVINSNSSNQLKYHVNPQPKNWMKPKTTNAIRRSSSAIPHGKITTNSGNLTKVNQITKEGVRSYSRQNYSTSSRPRITTPQRSGYLNFHQKNSKSFQYPGGGINVTSPRFNAPVTPRFGQGPLILRRSFNTNFRHSNGSFNIGTNPSFGIPPNVAFQGMRASMGTGGGAFGLY